MNPGERGSLLPQTSRGVVLALTDAQTNMLSSRLVSCTHAEHVFALMGMLSSGDLPVEVVLIGVESINEMTADALQAIRRIDTAAMYVLVTNDRDGEQVDEEIIRGFDAVLDCNASSNALGAIFHDAMIREDADAPDGDPTPCVEVFAEQPPSTQECNQEQPIAAELVEPTEDAVVGDIDLVDAIRRQDADLVDVARRLIVQQTGWEDVQIQRDGRNIEGVQSAKIDCEGRTFGTLTSSTVPEAELAPWAIWLGHWIALHEYCNELQRLGMTDPLTGAWNRRYYDEFIREAIAEAKRTRQVVTVMAFDIDDFKIWNDQYGHAAGDEILVETVRFLRSVIRQSDRVCRIGGDEFAVVFADLDGPREPGSSHPTSAETLARRFQREVCSMQFPKLGDQAPGRLTVSAGLASYPWDGHTGDALLELADQRALQSKRSGKNGISFGPDMSCEQPPA